MINLFNFFIEKKCESFVKEENDKAEKKVIGIFFFF